MGKPFANALIETYHHERFIEQAIISVLEQDFPPSEGEILVVDDGSADRTPEIVRQCAPEVRVIAHTPTDAIRNFFSSGTDAVVIGTFLVEK